MYLDNCSVQRPLDSKTHVRIQLEAEAVLGILELCESGRIDLVASEVLEFEVEKSPIPVRQEYGLQVLSRAAVFVTVNEQATKRANELKARGIRSVDALHLAAAEEANADYLCTCDDDFLRRARTMGDLRTKVVSPLELIGELEK